MSSQPVNVSGQPTNMASQSKNSSSDDQLAMYVDLPCSTRILLVTSLIRLTDILQSNQPIEKASTRKTIEGTMMLLVNLAPSKPTRSTNSDVQELKLLRTDRSNLINYLVDTKDALLSDQMLTNEARRRLVSENERVVIQLMKLSNPSAARSEDGEPASKRQRVECDVNKDLDHLKEQVSSLESTVSGLRSELSLQIKSVEIIRPEISFSFELAGVSKFFEVVGSEHYSDRFWCRGLQWCLLVRRFQKDSSKSLAFYLRCENDDPKAWSCKVDFEFILFSKLPDKQNCVRKLSYAFCKKIGYGNPSFVSYDVLTDEWNGYLKDDKITLGVEMKAGPVIRS